jgi:putative exporter of polyketide antibiotics
VALAGATWPLLIAGLTLALGVGGDSDHSFGVLVTSALAQAPAVWARPSLTVIAAGVLFASWLRYRGRDIG